MAIDDSTEVFPVAIFLDTNILDALPEDLSSGDLSGLVADADRIGAQAYIPDVVAREWLKHRMDKFFNTLEEYEGNRIHINRYFPNIPEFSITSSEFRSNVYRVLITHLVKSGCRLLGPPKATIRRLTARAVWAVPPFKYANKGFKDELIVLSILKLVERSWNYKTYVLVTKDNDFSAPELQDRFTRFKVRLERVTSLREAREFLAAKLDQAWKQRNLQLEAEVKQFLSKHWNTISEAVVKNTQDKGVSTWVLYGFGRNDIPENSNIKRLVQATPLEISTVDVGREDERTHEIPLTIGVHTRIELDLEENPFLYEGLFRKLGPDGWKVEGKPELQLKPRSVNIERQIQLYAVAKRVDSKTLTGFQLVDMRPDFKKFLDETDKDQISSR